MFKYLNTEFPLKAYCRVTVMGKKTAWPTFMAAFPLYLEVLVKVWSCLTVTMRGYGNKGFFTGPGTEPVSLYSSSINSQTLLDVSHVHAMHRNQGSKYTYHWETDLC